MTQQEQLEYNLRCLKVLQVEIDDVNWCEFEKRLPNPITGYYAKRHHTEQLCFHLEWAWIHLVIEKINNSKITAPINGIPDSITPYITNRRPIIEGLIKNNIEMTAQAINNFLIWYENKI